jgi:hypothetical protein
LSRLSGCRSPASSDAGAGWALFEAVENRFAAQARWSIPLAGAAGFWMVWRLGLWGVLADGSLWWLDAMAALWVLFMAAVFIVEPLAHARIAEMAERDPSALLRRLWQAHLVLLAAAGVTIVGAVAGAHGGLFGWRALGEFDFGSSSRSSRHLSAARIRLPIRRGSRRRVLTARMALE